MGECEGTSECKEERLSKSHVHSPEPHKGDCLHNGDSKAELALNDDDSDNWENTSSDGSDTDSGATWSSRCSSAASQRGKRSPQLAVRLLRGKRLKRTARRARARAAAAASGTASWSRPCTPPVAPTSCGRRSFTLEKYLCIRITCLKEINYRRMSQDGTIEMGIPSTQLYPIHHLDGQECFPGDFVVSGAANAEENQQLKHREYGVVQRVDHHGRTAIVHWYRTYTSADEPVPQMLHESEMSVYDLKDHPDFQYRPGTVVIRVANFTGEDANCTAGQVIDNFPSGRVKVWWVDGHTSMCWPQDLYKVVQNEMLGAEGAEVGEYDSEEGELWGSDGSGSEDSWETQSSAHDGEPRTPATPQLENIATMLMSDAPTGAAPAVPAAPGAPVVVPRLLEPRVAAHIERGRVAMRRLEEMFAKHPTLQSQEIMCKLLNLYKDCRFLDRLMGTSFFHEEHFLGLLERVRERGASTPRAGERRVHEQLARLFAPSEDGRAADDAAEPMEVVFHRRREWKFVWRRSRQLAAARGWRARMHTNFNSRLASPVENHHQASTRHSPPKLTKLKLSTVENVTPKKELHLNIEPVQASGSVIPVDNEKVSGKNENPATEPTDVDGTTRNVCYKLCSLIHSQLVKAHAEVSRRRPQELAAFLNSLMEKQNVNEEKLPYHFTVQYGALVVSMADQAGEGEPTEGKAGEGKDATIIVPALADGAPAAPTDTAPLATAEPVDVEPLPAIEVEGGEGFCILEAAPAAHRFRLSMLQPSEPRTFYSAVKREIKLLKSDLPPGVWVRGFEDRIDLLSLMIAGPTKTPYEGGLFVFDVQLGGEYPRAPPLCHYHSYCTDRLNPNLYEDGKVCVSLLGTWSGRGVEVWGKDSSLLQVIVSLQGLILNAEPYFNEAGYEKQKGTQQGKENSRMYNEMVLLKLVQSMTKMLSNPPEPFREEILQHLRANAASLCCRLEGWVHDQPDTPPPDFPLIPASRGFCLTLRSSLESFRKALRRHDIPAPAPANAL
ncbi:hypothetical protein MSG28_003996 [Choristoneura fumiferana]|uniref:Uncharacterized protein n=1 Tax=Choristoneura fumiferana TaxID=7141 RepID=A0ACC0KH27_CHOFU|nr:hypothetical protein MSG28_003996 [Choristoneura fumiferana]